MSLAANGTDDRGSPEYQAFITVCRALNKNGWLTTLSKMKYFNNY